MKAIKPIIGKTREQLKLSEDLEIPIYKTPITIPTTEDKSPNVMGSIDIVMNVWDEYSNRTGRIRNATTYVMEKMPKDKNWNREYIRNLRSIGNRLKDAGAYNQARHEDWTFIQITDFLRQNKKAIQISQSTNNSKILPPEHIAETHESELEMYLKKTRPGINL